MNFIRLDDIILSPPLPMIIAITIIIGFIFSGHKLGKWLYGNDNTYSVVPGYIMIIVFLSSFINILISFRIHNPWLIRITVISLFFYGIYNSKIIWKILYDKLGSLIRVYFSLSKLEKVIGLILCFNILNLLLCSLGPPTDADSLDYHLGVPLLWVRDFADYPKPIWLHSRLVGLGEVINYIGLVCGTDILGQLIQYSGLWIIWYSLLKFVYGTNQRILLALLIFSVPLNIWLVSTQKPLLFPSAVMIAGFCIYIQQRNSFNPFYHTVASLFILYSIACKYSFIVPGSIMILFGLWCAYKNKNIFPAIWILIGLSIVTIFPLYIRNLIFYGDPLSPFFENLKSNPDLYVLNFANMLKDYGGGVSFKNILLLPFKLGITLKPTEISTVLGIGVFGFILLGKISNPIGKTMRNISILITCGILFAGQTSPRYFMEAYWLLVGAIITVPWNTRIKWFKNVLLLQACLMAGLSIYGASVLFPGGLTLDKRHDVMSKVANGYNETKWLDENLPSDAVVIAEIRSNALMPRKFVSWDKFWIGKGQGETKRLQTMIMEKNVTALFLRLPLNPSLSWLSNCADLSDKKIKTFTRRTRNPLNVGEPYDMQLFMIDSSNSDCVLSQ